MSISALVSLYRSEKFLDRFLSSVSQQTISRDIELVCRLNEPSDIELLKLQDFACSFDGRVVISVANMRETFSASMNRCIEQSSSKFLAIWNVDDIRTPDSLARQFASMESGASFTYGPYIIVENFGDTEGRFMDVGDRPSLKFKRDMYLGPFMSFSKDALRHTGPFDESLRIAGDMDLAMRLARYGRGARIQSLLGYYLDAGEGLSTSRALTMEQFEERALIFARYGLFNKPGALAIGSSAIGPRSEAASKWVHKSWKVSSSILQRAYRLIAYLQGAFIDYWVRALLFVQFRLSSQCRSTSTGMNALQLDDG